MTHINRPGGALRHHASSLQPQAHPMQFTVKLTGAAPDIDAIHQALTEVDPSAMVDIEPNGQTLRIATWLETDQLSTLITQAGHPVAENDLERLPSECCGGCGG